MIGKYLEERSKNNLSYCALCAVTMEGCAAGKLHVLLPYCPLALVQKRNSDFKKKVFWGARKLHVSLPYSTSLLLVSPFQGSVS